MALNLLKREDSLNVGIAAKRKRAGRNEDYLLKVPDQYDAFALLPSQSLLHISYNVIMYAILRSATFDRWLRRLRDHQAVNRIVARLLAA